MTQSLKAVVQLLFLIAAVASIGVWVFPKYPDSTDWALRFALPAVAGCICWVLLRGSRRKEILPDLLLQTTGRYFERDGFCFAFAPSVKDGALWANVFFQNRHANPCTAWVAILPPRRSFWFGRLALPRIQLEIPCDGAAFGVASVHWPVPAKFQGRKVRLDLGCDRNYPSGKGKLMRFREGLRCGSIGGASGSAALSTALLAVGVIHISRPAAISIRLPANLTDRPAVDTTPHIEILWRPEFPTGGFPVLPAKTPDSTPQPPLPV